MAPLCVRKEIMTALRIKEPHQYFPTKRTLQRCQLGKPMAGTVTEKPHSPRGCHMCEWLHFTTHPFTNSLELLARSDSRIGSPVCNLPNSQQGALSLVSTIIWQLKGSWESSSSVFPTWYVTGMDASISRVVLSPQKSEKVHKLCVCGLNASAVFKKRELFSTICSQDSWFDEPIYVLVWNINLKKVIVTINLCVTYSLTLSFKTNIRVARSIWALSYFSCIFHDVLHFHCVNRWRPVVFGRKCTMSWVGVQGAPALLPAPVDTMKSESLLCFQINQHGKLPRRQLTMATCVSSGSCCHLRDT